MPVRNLDKVAACLRGRFCNDALPRVLLDRSGAFCGGCMRLKSCGRTLQMRLECFVQIAVKSGKRCSHLVGSPLQYSLHRICQRRDYEFLAVIDCGRMRANNLALQISRNGHVRRFHGCPSSGKDNHCACSARDTEVSITEYSQVLL